MAPGRQIAWKASGRFRAPRADGLGEEPTHCGPSQSSTFRGFHVARGFIPFSQKCLSYSGGDLLPLSSALQLVSVGHVACDVSQCDSPSGGILPCCIERYEHSIGPGPQPQNLEGLGVRRNLVRRIQGLGLRHGRLPRVQSRSPHWCETHSRLRTLNRQERPNPDARLSDRGHLRASCEHIPYAAARCTDDPGRDRRDHERNDTPQVWPERCPAGRSV